MKSLLLFLLLTAVARAQIQTNLSATEIARVASIGTLAGDFSSTSPTAGDTFSYSLAIGAGDANNEDFEISGTQLLTQRSLEVYPSGATLSVRVRTTNAANDTLEKVFTLQLLDDSDGDGLDDSWELRHFESLTLATGTGNNDADSLNNLEEQSAGTDPTDPDTDKDDLQDHVETKTGIYLSPSDTGSNPLVPDSDGDGLLDGAEVSNSNGSITDPNDSDSDSDGFSDRVEIENSTDPNNGAEFPPGLLPLQINEFLASNETGLEDGNGSRADWIEIFNPNSQAINLAGYHLTDTADDLKLWTFPTVNIGANDYLIVFASGDDEIDAEGNPHTNFRLAGSGEFLALVRPDGTSIDDQFTPVFPEQFTDISYGRPAAGGNALFFEDTTPNGPNTRQGHPGVVKDTNFSSDRGFYDKTFSLGITSATSGASIRYTLDGSLPTLANGMTYNGPITIDTTTNVRAIAYLEGENFLPTNVDTHTYIFIDDVATQNKTDLINEGWAPNWGFDSQVGRVIPADYDMDPRVVNDDLGLRGPGYSIRDSLLDIPTVSVTMKQEDFVNTRTGASTSPKSLYGTPRDRFERICSMEYIFPDGTRGFQEDCKSKPTATPPAHPPACRSTRCG